MHCAEYNSSTDYALIIVAKVTVVMLGIQVPALWGLLRCSLLQNSRDLQSVMTIVPYADSAATCTCMIVRVAA